MWKLPRPRRSSQRGAVNDEISLLQTATVALLSAYHICNTSRTSPQAKAEYRVRAGIYTLTYACNYDDPLATM